MGQKIHPRGMRLGYTADWESRWFSPRHLAEYLKEDLKIRKFVKDRLRLAAVSHIRIERAGKYIRLNLHTARPGIVIGKKGADVDGLRRTVEEMTEKRVYVNIVEVKVPELDAQLVAEGVALQLEKKVSFRQTLRRAIERSRSRGALGVKIMVAGRLGGGEIARTEWQRDGRIPLQTFRAEIDYGFAESHTKYGLIGVKVWIFLREHFRKTAQDLLAEVRAAAAAAPPPPPPPAPLVGADLHPPQAGSVGPPSSPAAPPPEPSPVVP